MSQIEEMRVLLQDGARKLGASAEPAKRSGNQMEELAGHLGVIAASLQTALDRIPLAVECAKNVAGSGGLTARELENVLELFGRVGRPAEDGPREMIDVLSLRILPLMRSGTRNASVIERGLTSHLNVLRGIQETSAENQGICANQAQDMARMAENVLPAAQKITELWAEDL